jgi:predicted dinucleotide-binding enzyme
VGNEFYDYWRWEKVIKAFNTTFAGTLMAGEVSGQPLDVFIAGDDADAKSALATALSASSLRPIDVGPLRRARQLEGLGMLHITLQGVRGTNWGSTIKILHYGVLLAIALQKPGPGSPWLLQCDRQKYSIR